MWEDAATELLGCSCRRRGGTGISLSQPAYRGLMLGPAVASTDCMRDHAQSVLQSRNCMLGASCRAMRLLRCATCSFCFARQTEHGHACMKARDFHQNLIRYLPIWWARLVIAGQAELDAAVRNATRRERQQLEQQLTQLQEDLDQERQLNGQQLRYARHCAMLFIEASCCSVCLSSCRGILTTSSSFTGSKSGMHRIAIMHCIYFCILLDACQYAKELEIVTVPSAVSTTNLELQRVCHALCCTAADCISQHDGLVFVHCFRPHHKSACPVAFWYAHISSGTMDACRGDASACQNMQDIPVL